MRLTTTLLPALTSATTLTLTIPPSPLLPNPSTLPPNTHALLSSANQTLSALLSKSNTIHFAHIPPGSYLCDVYTRDYDVQPLRVDVSLPESEVGREDIRFGWEDGDVEVWQTFRGNEWGNKGERVGAGRGGAEVDVRVIGERKFYEERSGFSPLSLLRNPMILIGIVGLGIMVGMPKLMENMDPEMREEFEKQQKSSPLAAGLTGGGNMGFDMASWMAGSNAKSNSNDNANTSGASSGAGKAKKRG